MSRGTNRGDGNIWIAQIVGAAMFTGIVGRGASDLVISGVGEYDG